MFESFKACLTFFSLVEIFDRLEYSSFSGLSTENSDVKRNLFRKLQGLHCIASIIVLCSLIRLSILEPCTGIQLLRIFYLGPWQTLKQVYRELQEAKRFFGKFQGQPLFPRKMVLYSSTKFGIIKI